MLDRRVSLNMLCYPYLDLPGFCAEARNREVQTVGLHARRFMEMPLADVFSRNSLLEISAFFGSSTAFLSKLVLRRRREILPSLAVVADCVCTRKQ